MARQTREQLVKYLTDAHSIEEQALAQMKRAPSLVEEPLAADFRRHLGETESQERRVRERLEALGASPATVKDVAGKVSGAGMVFFARLAPDTPGKLVAHAYSYEHMEIAAYELLGIVARDVGDAQTAAMAAEIADEERAMAERLAGRFDAAVEASLREVEPDDLDRQLNKYLADAHALEGQSRKLLEKGRNLGESTTLADLFDRHLGETIEQEARLERRLQSAAARPRRSRTRRCVSAPSTGARSWPPSPTRPQARRLRLRGRAPRGRLL